MRTHHHEDCPLCQRGECDGSGWIGPDFKKIPIAWLIIEMLYQHPEAAQTCIHVHRDKPNEILPELWIEELGVWVRTDGRGIHLDMGRGWVYPGWWQRWWLRRAIRTWQRRTGAPIVEGRK